MSLLDEIFNSSDSWFERFEKSIKRTIVKYLLGSLVAEDNVIIFNNDNLRSISGLNEDSKSEKAAKQYISKNLKKVLNETFKRYKALDKEATNGFIERYQNGNETILSDYYKYIRQIAVEKLATGTASLNDIIDIVDGQSVGYKNYAAHIYSSYQRDAANESRKKLGLRYAVYEGGTIKKTRDFCREKDGKIFEDKEIALWVSQDWKGKSTPYNPFIHLGGYNCRHRLNWVSDSTAEFLRKTQ